MGCIKRHVHPMVSLTIKQQEQLAELSQFHGIDEQTLLNIAIESLVEGAEHGLLASLYTTANLPVAG